MCLLYKHWMTTMKLENPIAPPSLNNIPDGTEFTIKATAKSFQILSSGLYSNKIRAVIRELSCNAMDSHTEAGNPDEPFVCHLPTKLEPYFYIRDFGTGLSHDAVMTLYASYFDSTRTDSNGFVGALGLGSKSPFSYVNSFTVTSIYNGIKRIYTAYMNDKGLPAISLVSESEVDERNGLEVKLPLTDTDDIRNFQYEASNVYQHFSVIPIFTNNSIKVKPYTDSLTEKLPGIYIANKHMSNSYAIQGNVAYPISLPNTEENKIYNAMLRMSPVVIYFDIGELDVAASREELSYIEMTQASIRKKLATLRAALTKDVTAIFDNKKLSDWEKAARLNTLNSDYAYMAVIDDYAKTHKVPGMNRIPGSKYTVPQLPIDELDGITVRKFERQRSNTKYNLSRHNFVPNDKILFVVNRKSEYHYPTHMQTYVNIDMAKDKKYSKYNTVIMVTATAASRDTKIDSLLKAAGNPPVVNYADLKTSYTRVKSGASILVATRSIYSSDVDYSRRKLEDITASRCIYVPVSRYQITDGPLKGQTLKKATQLLSDCGVRIRMYGVPVKEIADVEHLDNWVKAEVYFKSLAEQINYDELYTRYAEVFVSENLLSVSNFTAESLAPLGADHPIVKILTTPVSHRRTRHKPVKVGEHEIFIKDVADLSPILGIEKEVDNIQSLAYNSIKDSIARYPMLPLVTSSILGRDDISSIIDYIKLVDKSTKL